jgi:phosphoribosyl 1,2-cyclic phosphodiesterase
VLRFSLLGSGSSGNAILVSSPRSKILVDGGLSFKQLRLRAAEIGENLDEVQAVFITHEHSDHCTGLGVIARKLDVPVYMTRGTYNHLPKTVGEIPRVEFFEAGEHLLVDGLVVSSFSVSHDAADPVSYAIEYEGAKLGLAADLGRPSALVRTRLRGCHALVLESNHCPDMLRRGKYPPSLQQRIRGRLGHMSNGEMSSLLAELLHERLRVVVLVHISEENNTHDLALNTARQALRDLPIELLAARQDGPTPMYCLAP